MDKECKKGEYKDNTVIPHSPLVCFGGFGCEPCEYLQDCLKDYPIIERIIKLRKAKQQKE